MGSTMPKQPVNSAQKQPSQQVTSVSAGASLQSFGGRSVPNPILSTDGFQAKLAAQISGKPLSRLFTIEIFSGTGGLTAEVRRMGLAQSIGIDAPVTKQVKSPVIQINLAEEAGQAVLWRILRNDNVVAVHMGLPCGFEPSQGNQSQIAKIWGSYSWGSWQEWHAQNEMWLQCHTCSLHVKRHGFARPLCGSKDSLRFRSKLCMVAELNISSCYSNPWSLLVVVT